MSFEIIACRHCGTRALQISIEVRYRRRDCPCCHTIHSSKTSFHFCGLSCMAGWLADRDVVRMGWPCPECIDMGTGRSTGFSGGFPENGQCRTCGGTGRFREVAKDDYVINPETIARQAAFTKAINEAGGLDEYLKNRAKEGEARKARKRGNS